MLPCCPHWEFGQTPPPRWISAALLPRPQNCSTPSDLSSTRSKRGFKTSQRKHTSMSAVLREEIWHVSSSISSSIRLCSPIHRRRPCGHSHSTLHLQLDCGFVFTPEDSLLLVAVKSVPRSSRSSTKSTIAATVGQRHHCRGVTGRLQCRQPKNPASNSQPQLGHFWLGAHPCHLLHSIGPTRIKDSCPAVVDNVTHVDVCSGGFVSWLDLHDSQTLVLDALIYWCCGSRAGNIMLIPPGPVSSSNSVKMSEKVLKVRTRKW